MLHVRLYCENGKEYKRTTQDELDPEWKPVGCEEHETRDFVIEEETVA